MTITSEHALTVSSRFEDFLKDGIGLRQTHNILSLKVKAQLSQLQWVIAHKTTCNFFTQIVLLLPCIVGNVQLQLLCHVAVVP
jgi:hypothetical protein